MLKENLSNIQKEKCWITRRSAIYFSNKVLNYISVFHELQYKILFANGIVIICCKNNKLYLLGAAISYGLCMLGQQCYWKF